MRYLGGGIGHLEQFPPAGDDDEDTTTNDLNDVEVEINDFFTDGSDEGGDCSMGNDRAGEDEEGDDEEVEATEDEEMDDEPGELSDEEMGNVY